ncbi:hypothetical protein ABPG72_004957 [Tetrahymena utriculariae]
MSFLNLQKTESIIDYENQSSQYNDRRKSQGKLIGLNKFIIIGLVAISITFFVIFVINKETQDEINKRRLKTLSDQYKGFQKGPQISSRQYRDKKSKSKSGNEQDNKEKQPFLGDDHKNQEYKQDETDQKDSQTKINQEEKKYKNEDKDKSQHSSNQGKDESESEEINLQEETKKNKIDTTKKKEDQDKPLQSEKEQRDSKNDQGQQKQSQTNDEDKITDYRQENKVFFCPDAQFLFKLSCLDSCPEGFKPDNYDRVCKPKQITPLQIELKYYDKQNEQVQNSDNQNKKQNFYQVIKSLEYVQKDQVDYGFFFFNQIENDGFNFLNSHLSGSQLNSFLDNTGSIIVALGGEESYYLENEIEIKDIFTKTIQENPQIKNWYAVGLYDVGSYGALANLNKLIDLLDGAIVLNPNYMNMQDNYNKKVDLSKYLGTNILGEAQQNQEIYKSKDIILIEDQSSIYFQHTRNYQNFTRCNIIKYDNSKFSNNTDEKIEKLLLAYIEQLISKKKSTHIENL